MPWQPLVLRPGFPPVLAGISQLEAEYLGNMAAGCRVLEVGSAHGASTIALAEHAQTVLSVDPHTDVPGSREGLQANLTAYGVTNVNSLVISSRVLLPILLALDMSFDLCFVDGCHEEETVLLDAHDAIRLAPLCIFHDYGNPETPEVGPALDRFLALEHLGGQPGPGWMLEVQRPSFLAG